MSMQITPAELEVMKVVWDKPAIGALEVAKVLEAKQDWNIRTIKTLLSRLVDKEALETTQDGRRYLYHPKIKEHDYQSKEVGQFIDRLFGGRAAPLIAQLADSRGLSEKDIKELEALLGKLKE